MQASRRSCCVIRTFKQQPNHLLEKRSRPIRKCDNKLYALRTIQLLPNVSTGSAEERAKMVRNDGCFVCVCALLRFDGRSATHIVAIVERLGKCSFVCIQRANMCGSVIYKEDIDLRAERDHINLAQSNAFHTNGSAIITFYWKCAGEACIRTDRQNANIRTMLVRISCDRHSVLNANATSHRFR